MNNNIFIEERDTLEIDITYNCDIRCKQCNRACGVCPSSDIMKIEQIKKVLSQSLSLSKPYYKIWILGGEPTLHPELNKIIELLETYKNSVKDCVIRLWTHGWGSNAEEKINKIPSWIIITNSKKNRLVQPGGFDTFLFAPIDCTTGFKDDYQYGCKWLLPGKCGIGVTRQGIYVCAIAGAIDRIVGLDIGIQDLRKISEKRFRMQCKNLCKYCGHFLVNQGINPSNKSVSKTWKQLISDYKEKRPILTQY